MAVDQRSGYDSRKDVKAVLSLGSNAADARMKVSAAAAIIAARYGLRAITPVFATPDINMMRMHPPLAPVPPYANAMAQTRMPLPPLLDADTSVLVAELKAIEAELGRRKEHKQFGLVNADIDLVTVGDAVLRPADFLRPYFFPYALVL